MYKFLLTFGIAAVVLTGCSQQSNTGTNANTTINTATEVATNTTEPAANLNSAGTGTNPSADTSTTDGTYTLEEISTHNSASDCWMAIEDGVYDVTEYISSHPGGSDILRGCGIDATAAFNGGGGHAHSEVAQTIKENYRIGDLSN